MRFKNVKDQNEEGKLFNKLTASILEKYII